MRRFNFFDQHVVKQEGSEVHPAIQKLSVAHTAGSADSLWLGEATGEVRRLEKQGRVSGPCKVFEEKLLGLCCAKLLLAVGTDSNPPVAKYKVIEASAENVPSILSSHRVFRGEGQACCIGAHLVGRAGLVAVGSSGSLQLFRAQDIVQEKPYPVTLTMEDGSSQEVTSIQFLEQGARVVLFACTRSCICSWQVDASNQEIKLLNLDMSGGALPMCACAFPPMNALLAGKSDWVVAYDPDQGNMSAMPLDGQKASGKSPTGTALLLERFKSYFVVVTSDPSPSFGPSSMPKQTVTLVLAQKGMRFISFTSQFADVTHVVTAMQQIYLVSRGGADGNTALFELREKPLSERLDVLVKSRMFEWAAEVAMTSMAAPEVTAEIYRQHGDALFEKRAYDQALATYAKTVDLGLPLEPSYVVERYLDAQRIGHVAQYLKKLHEKEMAEAQHTALLLKCYTKLKDFSTLEEFLDTTPPSQYDHATAIEVLESASYHGLAAEVARKVGRFDDFVRISLEQFKNGMSTLEFLRSLPKAEAGRILLQRGRVLMRQAPKETMALIRHVCDGADDQGPTIDELLPVFVNDQSQLEAFLRSVLLDEGCQLPQAKAERLFPTLLELLVKSYSAACADGTANHEAANISADIMRLIRQYPSEGSLVNSLMLCQTYGFVDGFFYAAEKLQRFQLLMQWCFEHQDAQRLLEVCKRCGTDQSLWVQALSYLASPESGGGHLDEIQEVLRHIEDSDLMPLLLVIETLRNSEVTIGDVRPYLQAQYKRLENSLETSRGKSLEDRHEIARMEQEMAKLRTEARVFQNTRCFQCGLTLDVVGAEEVHFFCGHSYHSYCTPSDGTCPKCASAALPKLSLKEQREAQARNVEDFFKYLQGGAGDRGVQAMGEWCKFGAFDAIGLEEDD